MPQSSQLAGDVRAHQGDTQVCGHQPLSNWDGEPGEACPWIYGIMCSPAVPRLAPLGCRVPMSPQLSLPSLLRNLLPLCAGTPSHQHMALEPASAWGAPELGVGGAWAGARADPRLGGSQRIRSTAGMDSQGSLGAGAGSWVTAPWGMVTAPLSQAM